MTEPDGRASRWTPPGAPGGHRPALDGLRALAVIAVLLYHDDPDVVPGGFLGVSVFFTLSGFLVVSLLVGRSAGRQSLSAFWARRLRRLAPASLLALAGIVVFGATVATPEQVDVIPRDVAGAAAYVVNWVFIFGGTSYAAIFSQPSPVQHFWSLSIEEQLYVVVPVVVVLIRRRTSSLRVLAGVFIAAALASTAWMAVLHDGGARLDRVYYGTDTRLSEVCVGAALAVLLLRLDRLPTGRRAVVAGALGAVGVAVLVVGVATVGLDDGGLYTGGFLLVSLATGAAVLAVLVDRGPVRLLGRGPLPAIGRVSYGLYLYHFPLFLWLTAERTGLEGWSLLGLRVSVTGVVAAASYHLVEMPIRRGAKLGVSSGWRPALVPATAGIVIVAAFATAGRHDPEVVTALDAAPAAIPLPALPPDGVVDVLVLAPSVGAPTVEALSELSAGSTVRVAPPEELTCSSLVEVDGGRTCEGWAERWAAVVERVDPDVVLLVDGWSPEDLAGLAPGEDPSAVAEELMAHGLDQWGAAGAPTIWARTGVDLLTAARRDHDPFSQAMDRLQARRDDLRPPVDLDVGPYARDAMVEQMEEAVRLGARRPEADRRVMVVGDSQAQALGFGLERWGAAEGQATVWNAAVQGCGVFVGGQIRGLLGGHEGPEAQKCADTVAGWAHGVDAFDPDVVVVLSSVVDLEARQMPGWPGFVELGDPRFDRALERQYIDAVDALSAGGARVVWMRPPCVNPSLLQTDGVLDAERVAYLADEILPAVAKARPDAVETYPLDELLCPDGESLDEADGIQMRPDGVHLSPDGSDWVAGRIGPQVVGRG